MIYNNKYCFVIKNSQNNYFKFNLNNNILTIDEYKNSEKKTNSLKESVLDYSVDIDKNDNIHILFLSTLGELKYKIHYSTVETTITKVDLKNFNMKFLTLKLINSKPHIFYMVSRKINSNYWNIYHSYWSNKNWSNKKIADIYAKKYIYPYMIDKYKDELFLFYSKNCDNIYSLKKFNISFDIWGIVDDNIDIKSSHNTTFFINNSGIGIICYNTSINKNIQTLIKYKNLTGISSWSEDMLISNGATNSIHPSIFSINNFTYIMWLEGNGVAYRKCSALPNWDEKSFLNNISTTNLFNGIYISNNIKDANFKNTFLLFSLNNVPTPIINLKNSSQKNIINNTNTDLSYKKFIPLSNLNTIENTPINKAKDNTFNDSNTSFAENISKIADSTNSVLANELELKSNYITQLHSIVKQKDNSITHIQKNISTFKDKLNELSNMNSELKSQNDTLNKKLTSLTNTLYDNDKNENNFKITINQLSNTNNKLESENDTLNKKLQLLNNTLSDIEITKNTLIQKKETTINSLNNEIENLSSILENKEKTLLDYTEKLEDLKNENLQKKSTIDSLEKKLNKGFWNIFNKK